MKENEYKDLKDGIEDLMNTFGGISGDSTKENELPIEEGVEIEKVIKDMEELDNSYTVDNVNVDEFSDIENDVKTESKEAEPEVTAPAEKCKGTKDDKKTSSDVKDDHKEKTVKNKNPKKKNSSKKGKQTSEKSKKSNKSEGEKKVSAPNQKEEIDEKAVSPVRLVIILAAICAAVALLLGVVNLATKAQIEENNRKATLESIREIFDQTVEVEQISVPEGRALNSMYLVMKNGGVCGYSATVSPTGFGGPINLMVGISSEGKVVGVDVVSMAETPGLGSKTGSKDFLSQFTGASGEVKVDVISGATISSKAIAEGVNTVTTDLVDIASIAAERGMSVVPFVAEEIVTTAPQKEEPSTEEAVVPTPPETSEPVVVTEGAGAPEVSKGDTPPDVIIPNPAVGNGGINAEYVSDTTEFETLTTEPESTEPITDEESETE